VRKYIPLFNHCRSSFLLLEAEHNQNGDSNAEKATRDREMQGEMSGLRLWWPVVTRWHFHNVQKWDLESSTVIMVFSYANSVAQMKVQKKLERGEIIWS